MWLVLSSLSHAETFVFDATPAWPLCGHIIDDPPTGWIDTDGCPADRWGSSAYSDFPLSSTFGPRQKASDGSRYDYHRGIDIPAPVDTPVFAIADGLVNKVNDPQYTDTPMVQIQHYKPGYTDCASGDGCYFSNYLHLDEFTVTVTEGSPVSKGALIGYLGFLEFPHLHFEIRNAPGVHDPESNWQRDTVHPLLALPYDDNGAGGLTVSVDSIDSTDPTNPIVQASVSLPQGQELDFNRLEVEVRALQSDGTYAVVAQPGNTGIGTTPESTGYNVNPPWFDIMAFNRQYSYKNSTFFPWLDFKTGGAYESPYAADLPPLYDPNYHLDNALGTVIPDSQTGDFNGLLIYPEAFNTSSTEYRLTVTFNELVGAASSSDLCIRAYAWDINGNVAASQFLDVDNTHVDYAYINALSTVGIVDGCPDAYFYPNRVVTRDTLAIWLLRAMKGADFAPSAALGTQFSDISSTSFAGSWIEQLLADGITAGCDANLLPAYCSGAAVTRGALSKMLIKASQGTGYTPLTATTGVFSDIEPGDYNADWIIALNTLNISEGCDVASPPAFCPDQAVTRADLAVLIARAFNLSI